MWIKELHIKNFGKFSDRKIALYPGLNVIYGENESGKSTTHTFIRSCLFGMRKMRGRASKKDDFSHYQPWDNRQYYAGTMRFVCGNKVFRIERDFVNGDKEGILVCETDGELLSLENGDLDMLLGGIGEVAFTNTVSIGQLKNETDEGLMQELQNYIANVQESGVCVIRTELAFQYLKEKRKEIEKDLLREKQKQHEKTRQITEYIGFVEDEIEEIKEKAADVQEEISFTKNLIKELQEKDLENDKEKNDYQKNEVSKKEVSQPKASVNRRKKSSRIFRMLMYLELFTLAGMLLFCSLMGDYSTVRDLVVIMLLVSAVAFGINHYFKQWLFDDEDDNDEYAVYDDEDDNDEYAAYDEEEDNDGYAAYVEEEDSDGYAAYDEEEDSDEYAADNENNSMEYIMVRKDSKPQKTYSSPEKALERLYWQKEHLHELLEEKQIQMENYQQELAVLQEQTSNEQRYLQEEKKAALEMAYHQIQSVMNTMQGKTGIFLKNRTSEILKEVTDGVYTQVQMDGNMCVGVHAGERYVPLEQLSRGTIWQVYFAYRMAAGELLMEDEPLPILLDDAFVMYDEERLKQVLKWLSKQEQQVLLFTCQKREKSLLEEMNIEFHEIYLGNPSLV